MSDHVPGGVGVCFGKKGNPPSEARPLIVVIKWISLALYFVIPFEKDLSHGDEKVFRVLKIAYSAL